MYTLPFNQEFLDEYIKKKGKPFSIHDIENKDLTRVTFYTSVILPSNYSDVMQFNSYKDFDNYLNSKATKLGEALTTYQRTDNQIRLPGKLEDLMSANYVRVENYIGDTSEKVIYYGNVNSVNYLNQGVTSFDWSVDPWHTFNPIEDLTNIAYGSTFVERGHEPDVVTSPSGDLLTVNTNPEPISRTVSFTDSNMYAVDYPQNNKDVAFAIYWITRNFDENGNQTTSSIPDLALFAGAPSMNQAFIIPYNIKTGKTYATKFGNTSSGGGDSIDKVMKDLAVHKDLNGSRSITNAYSTDYFGVGYELNGNTLEYVHTGKESTGQYWDKFPGNTKPLFINWVGATLRKYQHNESALKMVKREQEFALKQDGISHTIRNVKTSSAPFAQLRVLDGYGNSYDYEPQYINMINPHKKLDLIQQGALSMEQKTHTFVDNYKTHTWFTPRGQSPQNDITKVAQSNYHGLWNTDPRSLPIVSETFTSTNALNQNSNQMVYASAENARRNNTISQDTSRANNNLGIDASNAQMNNNINTARGQSDLASGAYIGNALGLDRGTSNIMAGAFGGMTSGAMGGMAGGVGGMLLGGVTGGLMGGYKQGINYASQEMGIANQQANQGISNQASRDMLANSQNAQTQIMENNIQLSIDAFRAKQADLKNAPDVYKQSGGDALFSGLYSGQYQYLLIQTETGQQIRMTDLYFSAYGYSIGQLYTGTQLEKLLRGRKVWNFIKTSGIHLVSNKIPTKYIRQIEAMYNQGVRIWHEDTRFLITNQDNPQTTIGTGPIPASLPTYIPQSELIDMAIDSESNARYNVITDESTDDNTTQLAECID